jgi:acetyl-CoA hydrolase
MRLLADPIDLAEHVRPGDRVMWGQGTAEPRTLTRALVDQRARLGGVEVLLGVSFSETMRPEHADAITFTGFGGFGTNARLAKAGVLDVVPCHSSAISRLIDDGTLAPDVALVLLAPTDDERRFSLGPSADYVMSAIRRARVVIAEVDDAAPWTLGDTVVTADDVDVVVRSSLPVVEVPPPAVGEVERAIGGLVAERIPDGAVLQLGIGAIPAAVCAALHGKRDLGVHSGLVTDGVVDLMESGAVTNRAKALDAGRTVTSLLFGTERLYRFAHRNPAVSMRPSSYVQHPSTLARLERFCSINTALEVDLTGQVNAEVLGGVQVGAVGGAIDFVRGAALSPGGRSIVALPSTARRGTVSRIVARLAAGVTSTPRSDVDMVVTEHGVAELRGRTLRQRARALAAIAAPCVRAELEAAAEGVV